MDGGEQASASGAVVRSVQCGQRCETKKKREKAARGHRQILFMQSALISGGANADHNPWLGDNHRKTGPRNEVSRVFVRLAGRPDLQRLSIGCVHNTVPLCELLSRRSFAFFFFFSVMTAVATALNKICLPV